MCAPAPFSPFSPFPPHFGVAAPVVAFRAQDFEMVLHCMAFMHPSLSYAPWVVLLAASGLTFLDAVRRLDSSLNRP